MSLKSDFQRKSIIHEFQASRRFDYFICVCLCRWFWVNGNNFEGKIFRFEIRNKASLFNTHQEDTLRQFFPDWNMIPYYDMMTCTRHMILHKFPSNWTIISLESTNWWMDGKIKLVLLIRTCICTEMKYSHSKYGKYCLHPMYRMWNENNSLFFCTFTPYFFISYFTNLATLFTLSFFRSSMNPMMLSGSFFTVLPYADIAKWWFAWQLCFIHNYRNATGMSNHSACRALHTRSMPLQPLSIKPKFEQMTRENILKWKWNKCIFHDWWTMFIKHASKQSIYNQITNEME